MTLEQEPVQKYHHACVKVTAFDFITKKYTRISLQGGRIIAKIQTMYIVANTEGTLERKNVLSRPLTKLYTKAMQGHRKTLVSAGLSSRASARIDVELKICGQEKKKY